MKTNDIVDQDDSCVATNLPDGRLHLSIQMSKEGAQAFEDARSGFAVSEAIIAIDLQLALPPPISKNRGHHWKQFIRSQIETV